MKTFRLLFLFFALFVSHTVFSQDTISTHITSGCLHDLRFAGPPEYHFTRTADSIVIWGRIGANCGSSHIAIISRLNDMIVVATKDTGVMATCTCNFNFRISIKAAATDTLVMLNDSLFNMNKVIDGLSSVDSRFRAIDVIYDSGGDCFLIERQDGYHFRMLSIYDGAGRHVLSVSKDRSTVDMSGFDAGLYLLDFKMEDDSHIIKKVLKK